MQMNIIGVICLNLSLGIISQASSSAESYIFCTGKRLTGLRYSNSFLLYVDRFAKDYIDKKPLYWKPLSTLFTGYNVSGLDNI